MADNPDNPLILEPPETPPPPLPARNFVRDDPLYRRRRQSFHAELINNCIAATSPSQHIFDELDRELKDTQERLVSAIYEGNKMQSLWESEDKFMGEDMLEDTKGISSERNDGDKCTAMEFLSREAELQMNSSINCKRWPKGSSVYSQLVRDDQGSGGIKGGEDSDHTTRLRNDDHRRPPSSHYSVEEDEDARAEAWLARGLLSSEPVPVERSKRPSKDEVFAYEEGSHHTMSPFPQISAKTGKREYVPSIVASIPPTCPVFPLNNGRDVYGNHIPTNSRNLFATYSPTDSPTTNSLGRNQLVLEKARQKPQAHLRGGWGSSFWRRSDHMEPRKEQESANEQDRSKRYSPARTSRFVNATKDQRPIADRAVPNVRSQYAVNPSPNLVSKNQKPLDSTTKNERQDRAGRHDIYSTSAHRLYRQRYSDPLDVSPYDDLSYIFNKHFGIQTSPLNPTSSGTRSPAFGNRHHKPSARENTRGRTGKHSPPIDDTRVPPDKTSAPQLHGSPIYRPVPPQDRERRPNSPESLRVATTIQSLMTTLRQDKRWNKELPHTPPKDPAPRLPKEVYPYIADYIGSPDDESIFSDRTTDDNLKGLADLQTSGPYKKAKQAREARRIWEEQERRRREASRDRDIDIHTITPSMSVSQRQVRLQPPLRDARRLGRVPENESYHSSERTVPRQNTHERFIQRYPPSGPAATEFATPAIEPARIVTARPNMNSVELAIHLAGKITRFLLATPSDPKLKTYSRRYPLTEDQQRVNASVYTNTSVLERISDVAAPQVQQPRGPEPRVDEKQKTQKLDKGKGKAIPLGTATDTHDFTPTPRATHPSTLSHNTAVNNNTRYTGATLAGPSSSPPARNTNRHPGYDARAVRNPMARYYEESDTGTEWPVQDEQGNVIVSQRKGLGVAMRGGGGGGSGDDDGRSGSSVGSSVRGSMNGRGKERERKMSPWGNGEYALAMHSLG